MAGFKLVMRRRDGDGIAVDRSVSFKPVVSTPGRGAGVAAFAERACCMLRRPRARAAAVAAVAAVAACGMVVTQAPADTDLGTGMEGSKDVVRIGQVDLPGTMGVAFSSKEPLAYATARSNGGLVATLDISDPTKPKKLGEVSVVAEPYMEDMNLGERPDGKSFVLVRGQGGGLQIVDVTNPTKPRKRGYLDVAVHTWTCVTPECNFAYGGSAPIAQFPVADLRNLDNPTLFKMVSSPTQGFHDWNRDSAGIMWGAGFEGIGAYQSAPEDATDPTPTLLNSSDANGVQNASEYNNLELHGSLRPNAQRFMPDGRARGEEGVEFGNILLVSEESNDHDCTDSFQTWYVPHLDEERYSSENPTGVPGGGSITPLDNWSLLNDTTPGETRPLVGEWCSVHWFDYHQNGFVVLPAYNHGTHILDVRDAKNITQWGYHFTSTNVAEQSYWVPERDGAGRTTGRASTLVYTADSGDINRVVLGQEPVSGGIDIFRVTLPK